MTPVERDVPALRGVHLLTRADALSWSSVLEPHLRDVADPAATGQLFLDELELLVGHVLEAISRHRFPEFIVHVAPRKSDNVDAIAVTSVIAAHRAERLVQCVELGGGALDSLEHGSVQLAAIAARSLFEIALLSYRVHTDLLELWSAVHGQAEAVRKATGGAGELWSLLADARLATRVEELTAGGPPKATNITTHLKHLEKAGLTPGVIYDMLCEATHPNVEAQAVLWRLAAPDRAGRQRVAFEPTASQSPVKLAVVDAIRFAFKVLVPYSNDLWWIAAETASVWRFPRNPDTFDYGLPGPTGRNELCCCGSGVKTKNCDHPEPTPLSMQMYGTDFGSS